jgi:hypothetical protein
MPRLPSSGRNDVPAAAVTPGSVRSRASTSLVNATDAACASGPMRETRAVSTCRGLKPGATSCSAT